MIWNVYLQITKQLYVHTSISRRWARPFLDKNRINDWKCISWYMYTNLNKRRFEPILTTQLDKTSANINANNKTSNQIFSGVKKTVCVDIGFVRQN